MTIFNMCITLLFWCIIQHQGSCDSKWYGSPPTSCDGSWAKTWKWKGGKLGGLLLFKLSVICTQKHGRWGWNFFSRVVVATMQCDWEAQGRTMNSAINFGKRSTRLTKKAVNSISFHLKMFIIFPSPLKSIDVTIKPNWIREGQSSSKRVISSHKSDDTLIFNLKTINVKKSIAFSPYLGCKHC